MSARLERTIRDFMDLKCEVNLAKLPPLHQEKLLQQLSKVNGYKPIRGSELRKALQKVQLQNNGVET